MDRDKNKYARRRSDLEKDMEFVRDKLRYIADNELEMHESRDEIEECIAELEDILKDISWYEYQAGLKEPGDI